MLGGRIAPRPAPPARRPDGLTTLAQSKRDGSWSGQGVTDAGVTYRADDRPAGGPVALPTPVTNLSVFDKLIGRPRPQRGGAVMGHSLEFFEFARLDGSHTELRRRALFRQGEMLPWRPTAATRWRDRPRSGDAPPACPAGGTAQ